MKTEIPTESLGIPVEVGDIDGELKKLWELDEASTNASLMNFIVYTEDPMQLVANAESIQELTRENACRAVLIAMDHASDEASLEAWITAHCHLAHGKKSICSEQISFLLRGRSLGRLRNTVFGHLNSDLPLVFWWQGEFSSHFEERLYRMFNRLIFDSVTWSDPLAGFQKLNEAREDSGGKLITQDLSWTRSYHFRLALARLFDDPLAQKSFSKIEEVVVRAHPEFETPAFLLMSWMIERSGWQVVTGSRDGFDLETNEGQKIRANFVWDDTGAPLSELAVKAPDLELKISRERGDSHLLQDLCSGGHCVRMKGPADVDEPIGLVASQLSRGGKNSLFLKVLPQLMQLLEIVEED